MWETGKIFQAKSKYTGSKPQFRKLEVGTLRERVRGGKTREWETWNTAL